MNQLLTTLDSTLKPLTSEKELLSDATNELELADDEDPIPMKRGDVFFIVPTSKARELMEKRAEVVQDEVQELEAEKEKLTVESKALKGALYSRFKDQINLERD